jgi:precorrin-3B C17-methyltransferase
MTGALTVVGLGPGDADQTTPEASHAIAAADTLFGYATYLQRVPALAGQRRASSDNGDELERARSALHEAVQGSRVVVVSGGDAGVFAMAAAVCEAVDHGPPSWRALDVAVIPGVTAMLAVAARVGAPLGHDFCAISLSDNLKPWSLIERRLAAAAGAGFVIALYNPASRARPWQLERAFELLRGHLADNTPVVFGRAVGRADECVRILTLDCAGATPADMATCIIVGSSHTRFIERADRSRLVYTPRAVGAPNR